MSWIFNFYVKRVLFSIHFVVGVVVVLVYLICMHNTLIKKTIKFKHQEKAVLFHSYILSYLKFFSSDFKIQYNIDDFYKSYLFKN